MWKHAKNSMKELKRPNSVFYAGYVRSSLLKTPKTCKTRETKTRITQNVPIVWLIQGSTMSKSMPRAFQKCGTFRYSKVLNQSYWPPKSGQIRGKKFLDRRRHKKKTRLQYSVPRPHMNRIGFSHGKFDILFISGLKTAYWSRVFFLWRRLFSVTSRKFQTLLTLSSRNSRSKTRKPNKSHIFEIAWTSAFSWCYPYWVYGIRMASNCGKYEKIHFLVFLGVRCIRKCMMMLNQIFWTLA